MKLAVLRIHVMKMPNVAKLMTLLFGIYKKIFFSKSNSDHNTYFEEELIKLLFQP